MLLFPFISFASIVMAINTAGSTTGRNPDHDEPYWVYSFVDYSFQRLRWTPDPVKTRGDVMSNLYTQIIDAITSVPPNYPGIIRPYLDIKTCLTDGYEDKVDVYTLNDSKYGLALRIALKQKEDVASKVTLFHIESREIDPILYNIPYGRDLSFIEIFLYLSTQTRFYIHKFRSNGDLTVEDIQTMNSYVKSIGNLWSRMTSENGEDCFDHWCWEPFIPSKKAS
jgi:hypothetical protein